MNEAQHIDPDLAELMKEIRAVLFDFDGVFTNNRVLVLEDGREAVICHRGDGLGLSRIRTTGVELAIISSEVNPVVSKRAAKLKLPCFQAIEDKVACLRNFAADKGLDIREIAFVGNDINDAECLQLVGLPVVVRDAEAEVVPLAKLVLTRNGGEGAVREFCDMLWHVKGGEA